MLQQIETVSVSDIYRNSPVLVDESLKSPAGAEEQKICVAKHRRTSTYVYYYYRKAEFGFVENRDLKEPKWSMVGRWVMPPEVDAANELRAVLPIEAYDLFLLVMTNSKTLKSSVIFLDLKGKLMFKCELLKAESRITSVDIDQRRKEMIVGLESGRVLCYYVNQVKTSIRISRRIDIKLTKGMGKYASKISSFDTIGLFLVLTDEGNILCFHTSRLEIVYVIPRKIFRGTPSRIWTDKFGQDFIVQCDIESSSPNTKRYSPSLEYWKPPFEYATCEAGQFSRAQIPCCINGVGVEEVCIESVQCEPGTKSLIAVLTSDDKVHMCGCVGDGSLIKMQSLAVRTLPVELLATVPSIADLSPGSADRMDGSRHLKAELELLSSTPFGFSPDSVLVPDCVLTFTWAMRAAMYSVAMHFPSETDQFYRQKCEELLMAQLKETRPSTDFVNSVKLDRNFEAFKTAAEDEKVRRVRMEHAERTAAYIRLRKNDSYDDEIASVFTSNTKESEAVGLNPRLQLNSPDDMRVQVSIDDYFQAMNDTAPSESATDAGILTATTTTTIKSTANSPSRIGATVQLALPRPLQVEHTAPSSPSSVSSSIGESLETARQSRGAELNSPTLADAAGGNHMIESRAGLGMYMLDEKALHEMEGNKAIGGTNNAVDNPFFRKVSNSGMPAPVCSHFTPHHVLCRDDLTKFPDDRGPGSIMQVIVPSGLLLSTKRLKSTAMSPDARATDDVTISIFDRAELRSIMDADMESSVGNLEFKLFSIAQRSGAMAVVTLMKEVFVFDIHEHAHATNSTKAHRKPLRIELDLKHNNVPTCITNADVAIKMPEAQSIGGSKAKPKGGATAVGGRKNEKKAATTATTTTTSLATATEPSDAELMVIGAYTLFLCGDSDGNLHYSFNTPNNTIAYHILRAHPGKAITHILCVGNTMRNQWTVGTEWSLDSGSGFAPVATVGSAIITVASDGEVKVWQPLFLQGGAKENTPKAAQVHELFHAHPNVQWRLSGVYSAANCQSAETMKTPGISGQSSHSSSSSGGGGLPRMQTICGCCLDATGLNLIMTFDSGNIEVWGIPGLLSGTNASQGQHLMTSQLPLFLNEHAHSSAVTDVRLWVHMPNTNLKVVDLAKENEKRDLILAELATYVRGVDGKTVGYSYKEMRNLSLFSSMVTSSQDSSLVLWKFSVEQSGRNSLLSPVPVRQFHFSNPPRQGLCSCLTETFGAALYKADTYVWRISAIVDGCVVNVYQETRRVLFKTDEVLAKSLERGSFSTYFVGSLNKNSPSGISSNSLIKMSVGGEDGGIEQGQRLPSMMAICRVEKPSVLVSSIARMIASKEKLAHTPSWAVLQGWCMQDDPTDLHIACLAYDNTAAEEEDEEDETHAHGHDEQKVEVAEKARSQEVSLVEIGLPRVEAEGSLTRPLSGGDVFSGDDVPTLFDMQLDPHEKIDSYVRTISIVTPAANTAAPAVTSGPSSPKKKDGSPCKRTYVEFGTVVSAFQDDGKGVSQVAVDPLVEVMRQADLDAVGAFTTEKKSRFVFNGLRLVEEPEFLEQKIQYLRDNPQKKYVLEKNPREQALNQSSLQLLQQQFVFDNSDEYIRKEFAAEIEAMKTSPPGTPSYVMSRPPSGKEATKTPRMGEQSVVDFMVTMFALPSDGSRPTFKQQMMRRLMEIRDNKEVLTAELARQEVDGGPISETAKKILRGGSPGRQRQGDDFLLGMTPPAKGRATNGIPADTPALSAGFSSAVSIESFPIADQSKSEHVLIAQALSGRNSLSSPFDDELPAGSLEGSTISRNVNISLELPSFGKNKLLSPSQDLPDDLSLNSEMHSVGKLDTPRGKDKVMAVSKDGKRKKYHEQDLDLDTVERIHNTVAETTKIHATHLRDIRKAGLATSPTQSRNGSPVAFSQPGSSDFHSLLNSNPLLPRQRQDSSADPIFSVKVGRKKDSSIDGNSSFHPYDLNANMPSTREDDIRRDIMGNTASGDHSLVGTRDLTAGIEGSGPMNFSPPTTAAKPVSKWDTNGPRMTRTQMLRNKSVGAAKRLIDEAEARRVTTVTYISKLVPPVEPKIIVNHTIKNVVKEPPKEKYVVDKAPLVTPPQPRHDLPTLSSLNDSLNDNSTPSLEELEGQLPQRSAPGPNMVVEDKDKPINRIQKNNSFMKSTLGLNKVRDHKGRDILKDNDDDSSVNSAFSGYSTDSTVVTSFFDRNVPNLYVDHPVDRPPVLVREVLDSARRAEIEATNTTFSASLSRPDTNPDGTPFDVSSIRDHLDKCSLEELEMLDHLDPTEKAALILEMETMYNAKGPRMDVNIDLVDVSDTIAVVGVSSAKGGTATLVVVISRRDASLPNSASTGSSDAGSVGSLKKGSSVKNNNKKGGMKMPVVTDIVVQPVPDDLFLSHEAMNSIEGFSSLQTVLLTPGKYQEVVLKWLEPDEKYTIYAVPEGGYPSDADTVASTKSTSSRVNTFSSSNAGVSTRVSFNTQMETHDMEWYTMAESLKQVELFAAVRSNFVRSAASANFPKIICPDDELIAEGLADNIFDPEELYIDEDGGTDLKNFNPKKLSRGEVWQAFIGWWTGGEHSIRTTKVRAAFLIREQVFFAHNINILQQCRRQGFLTEEQTKVVAEFVHVMAGSMLESDVLIKNLPVEGVCKEFDIFRSWTKGGKMVRGFMGPFTTEHTAPTGLLGGKKGGISAGGVSIAWNNSPGDMSVASDAKSGIASFDDEDESEAPLVVEELGIGDNGDSVEEKRDVMCEADVEETPQEKNKRFVRLLLDARAARLEQRVREHDLCYDAITATVEMHCYAVEAELKFDDLTYKRADLSEDDIEAIMSSRRLVSLCVKNKLTNREVALTAVPNAALGSPPFTYEAMAGIDIFKKIKCDRLKPDGAPLLEMAYLPGSTRRPAKAWQLCTAYEKSLELSLACSFDTILEMAMGDGVEVPDLEDIALVDGHDLAAKNEAENLSPDEPAHIGGNFPLIDSRVRKFRAWYAGQEDIERIPGRGTPTLARTVFAEEWENKNVNEDPEVVEQMIEGGIPLPAFMTPLSAASTDDHDSDDEKKLPGTLLEAYTMAICKPAGAALRLSLLTRHLTVMADCRKLSMMRVVWPESSVLYNVGFLFPRMGLLTPQFSLPDRRIKLWPSKSIISYTFKEIDAWYTPEELDADDLAMHKAEKAGVKLRAYMLWLSQAKERVAEARLLMQVEDDRSLLWKETKKKEALDFDKLRERQTERVLQEVADDSLEERTFFLRAKNLPKEFWYILDGCVDFGTHGNGTMNEDELHDHVQEQRDLAHKALEAEQDYEMKVFLERKKVEIEEANRVKKEEVDRRLLEGVNRRRKLRELFEDLKKQRVYREEAAAQRILDDEHAAELVAYEAEEARLLQQRIDKERAIIARESVAMQQEDVYMADLRHRIHETYQMEYEDVSSYIQEQAIRRKEERLSENIAMIRELYVPFEPFQFKKRKVKNTELHNLLQDEYHLDSTYQNRIDEMDEASFDVASNTSDSLLHGAAASTYSTRSKHSDRHDKLWQEPATKTDEFENFMDLVRREKKEKLDRAKKEARELLGAANRPALRVGDFEIDRTLAAYPPQWMLGTEVLRDAFVSATSSTWRAAVQPRQPDSKSLLSKSMPFLAPLRDNKETLSFLDFDDSKSAASKGGKGKFIPTLSPRPGSATGSVGSSSTNASRLIIASKKSTDREQTDLDRHLQSLAVVDGRKVAATNLILGASSLPRSEKQLNQAATAAAGGIGGGDGGGYLDDDSTIASRFSHISIGADASEAQFASTVADLVQESEYQDNNYRLHLSQYSRTSHVASTSGGEDAVLGESVGGLQKQQRDALAASDMQQHINAEESFATPASVYEHHNRTASSINSNNSNNNSNNNNNNNNNINNNNNNNNNIINNNNNSNNATAASTNPNHFVVGNRQQSKVARENLREISKNRFVKPDKKHNQNATDTTKTSVLSQAVEGMVEGEQIEWVRLLENQRKLAFASFSAIDAIGAGGTPVKYRNKPKPVVIETDEEKAAKVAKAQLKADLKKFGIVDPVNSLGVGFKTMQTAKLASDSVRAMKREKDALSLYATSNAVLEDSYYLQTCLPGIREHQSIEQSGRAQQLLREIESRERNNFADSNEYDSRFDSGEVPRGGEGGVEGQGVEGRERMTRSADRSGGARAGRSRGGKTTSVGSGVGVGGGVGVGVGVGVDSRNSTSPVRQILDMGNHKLSLSAGFFSVESQAPPAGSGSPGRSSSALSRPQTSPTSLPDGQVGAEDGTMLETESSLSASASRNNNNNNNNNNSSSNTNTNTSSQHGASYRGFEKSQSERIGKMSGPSEPRERVETLLRSEPQPPPQSSAMCSSTMQLPPRKEKTMPRKAVEKTRTVRKTALIALAKAQGGGMIGPVSNSASAYVPMSALRSVSRVDTASLAAEAAVGGGPGEVESTSLEEGEKQTSGGLSRTSVASSTGQGNSMKPPIDLIIPLSGTGGNGPGGGDNDSACEISLASGSVVGLHTDIGEELDGGDSLSVV